MRTKQRISLAAGLFIIVLVCLFPPRKTHPAGGYAARGFLLAGYELYSWVPHDTSLSVRVDYERLHAEWVLVAAATLAVTALLGLPWRRDEESQARHLP